MSQILDEAETKIFQIGEEGSRNKQGFQSMDSLVVDLLDRVQEMADNTNDITGVPTGFADLDELTSPAFAATVLSRALYLDGRSLQDDVSPDTFRFIRERASRAGLPLEALQRMRPWMVAVTLQGLELNAGGFDPALGVDRFFFDRAKRSNIPVLPLEAAIDQITYLERLGPSLQDALVKEQVQNAAAEVTSVKQMAAAWRAGDTSTLETLALGDMKDAPAIYQALIVERNRNWLPKMRSCFDTKRCFVVVGAAHLLGPDGLLAALRGQGLPQPAK